MCAQLSQAEAAAAGSAESLAKVQAHLDAACAEREAAQQEMAAAKAAAETAAAGSSEELEALKSQLSQVGLYVEPAGLCVSVLLPLFNFKLIWKC